MSQTIRRISPTLFVVSILFGLLAGQALTRKAPQLAPGRHQNPAVIKAAHDAMDQIKADMATSGYGKDTTGAVTKAFSRTLAFRDSDGRTITYQLEGGQLLRDVDGERTVLLENVGNFKVQAANDGETVNVVFWVPVDDDAPQVPVFAHFVREPGPEAVKSSKSGSDVDGVAPTLDQQ